MTARTLTAGLYALFGTAYLASGVTVCLVKTGLLPEPVLGLVNALSEGDPRALHISQEFGTHMVILGVVTFWFLRHYDRSRPFHWAMTAGWGLFALIHWFDVRGPIRSVAGPLVNSVPFFLLLAVGLVRLRSDREMASRPHRPFDLRPLEDATGAVS
jgi:hypothetical protein